MIDASYEKLPDNWDESLLYLALQALRCDPASSTSYAPAELILGRPLVCPIELDRETCRCIERDPQRGFWESWWCDQKMAAAIFKCIR